MILAFFFIFSILSKASAGGGGIPNKPQPPAPEEKPGKKAPPSNEEKVGNAVFSILTKFSEPGADPSQMTDDASMKFIIKSLGIKEDPKQIKSQVEDWSKALEAFVSFLEPYKNPDPNKKPKEDTKLADLLDLKNQFPTVEMNENDVKKFNPFGGQKIQELIPAPK